MPHPKDTPLEQWPSGWLKLEIASLLDTPAYLWLHDSEKRRDGYPVTDDEMRAFIAERRAS